MRKFLYYIMLLLFLVCAVWNALSKKDSIMGTVTAADSAPQSGWATVGVLH